MARRTRKSTLGDQLYGPTAPVTPEETLSRLRDRLGVAERQRDEAIRTLTSRSNLAQTVEKVDQLALTFDRVIQTFTDSIQLLQWLLGEVGTPANRDIARLQQTVSRILNSKPDTFDIHIVGGKCKGSTQSHAPRQKRVQIATKKRVVTT
jgi:hypothetical protein